MTLNGVMSVTLRYFTEFGKHTFQHITAASSCGGIYAGVFVFCITCTICCRKESSRSLSHLLMSFLYDRSILFLICEHAFDCDHDKIYKVTVAIAKKSTELSERICYLYHLCIRRKRDASPAIH